MMNDSLSCSSQHLRKHMWGGIGSILK